MSSVQERLKLKRAQIDTWSTREKLCLASAVLRSGDQNWMSVSRSLKAFGDPNRPNDWFSQKSCAVQYAGLLENVETPKRKKRTDKGEASVETPGSSIVRMLTEERIEELRRLLNEDRLRYAKLKDDVLKVKCGAADNKLGEMMEEIEEDKRQAIKKAEAHEKWLKEREEKKMELERAWKPPAVVVNSPHKRKNHVKVRRSSNHSEPSSEAECAVDSPLSEPLNIDVISEDNVHEVAVEPKPSQTPTSPLLTSLLKSPSPAPTSQGSSILHSAITSLRGASPTITSLLSSAPCVPGTVNVSVAPPTTVSSSLKNLVSSAIGAEQHHQPPALHNPSPAAGAPTLSMLLELPPSLPGKPLPELPSVSKTATTMTPSTVSTVVPSVPSITSSTEKLIAVRTIATTAATKTPVKSHKSSALQGEDLPLLAQDFEITGSSSKGEEVELVQVDSTRNSVVTQQLQAESKEELIEEVLIEEVVVNDDAVITSEIISAPLEDVVVAADNQVLKLKQKDREEIKKYIEMSQASEMFSSVKEKSKPVAATAPIVMSETISSIVKDDKEQCVEALIETSSQGLPEIVNEEEGELEVVPESEVELSTDAVAEVIEITADQEGSIPTEVVTECEPCIQELENMEVIILDKVQELEAVEIVEDIKELGCEVVEVVMTGQEKGEDSKEEAEELNQVTIKTEISSDDSEPNDAAKEVQNPSNIKFTFQKQKIANVVQKPKFATCSIVEKTGHSSDSSFEDVQDVETVDLKLLNVGENKELVPDYSYYDTSEESDENKYVIASDESPDKAVVPLRVHLPPWEPPTPENEVNEELEADEGEVQNVQFTNVKKENEVVCSEEDFKGFVESETTFVISKAPSARELTEQILANAINPSSLKKEKLEAAKKNISKDNTVEKDKTKLLAKQESALVSEKMKLVDEKKELAHREKKDLSESVNCKDLQEENFSTKAMTKKDSLVIESKKLVKDEKERSKSSVKRDLFKHEVSSKELPLDTSKEIKKSISAVDSDMKGSQNEEKKVQSTRELAVAKKDIAKDFLDLKKDAIVLEGDIETLKHDLSRHDYKEDFVRKEGAKRSYSKDDKKDYVKKRTHAKEVSKPKEVSVPKEGGKPLRKLFRDSSDSESSVVDSPTSIFNAKESKKTLREIILGDFEEKEDASNADTCVKIHDNAQKADQSDKDVKITDLQVKSPSEVDKISSNPLSKEIEDLHTDVDAKLDDMENVEEKAEKSIIFRSETPSTEDDKTNDAEVPKSLGKRRLAAISAVDPSSPAPTSDEEREYKSWKKSIMLLYGRLATHKYASLFLRPITDDQAPGYSSVVHRPIDLLTIKKNIETGVIRTTAEFQRDVMLMFLNSIMYNKSSHFVHKMALQMQSEGMQHIQDYLTTQMLVQAAGEYVPIRRETRTMEANKQREMLKESEDGESKRKRNGPDGEKTMKRKKVDE